MTGNSALAALESLSADDLLAYLNRQRWFGAKGGAPSSARVVDAVELPWGDGAYAVARVAVELGGGGQQTYQLVVSARGGEDAIGGEVSEAARDDDFRRGLIDALSQGASAESNGLRWIAEPLGSVTLPATSKVGSAEQSNTSI